MTVHTLYLSAFFEPFIDLNQDINRSRSYTPKYSHPCSGPLSHFVYSGGVGSERADVLSLPIPGGHPMALCLG